MSIRHAMCLPYMCVCLHPTSCRVGTHDVLRTTREVADFHKTLYVCRPMIPPIVLALPWSGHIRQHAVDKPREEERADDAVHADAAA